LIATYRFPMPITQTQQQLDELSAKLDALGAVLARVLDENRSLRTSQEQLIGERAALLSKNEQARSRVEAMILRLKSLEQNT
jgi:cell division protein ZapB